MEKANVISEIVFVLGAIIEAINHVANFVGSIFKFIISLIDDEEVDVDDFLDDEILDSLKCEEDSIKLIFEYLGYIFLRFIVVISLICITIATTILCLICKGPIATYISRVISYSFNIVCAISAIIVVLLGAIYFDGGKQEVLDGIDFIKTSGVIEFARVEIKNILNI